MGFIAVFLIFFTSKVFEGSESQFLENYNNDYFNFLVSGIVVLAFMSKSFSSMTYFISESQTLGYIEQLTSSKIQFSSVLLATLPFSLLQATLRIIFIYIFAILSGKSNTSPLEMLEVVFLLLFSCLPFIGISLAIVSIIIIYKRATFINSLFFLGCFIFSGIAYPITVLPNYLQNLAFLFPMTFSVNLVRGRTLEGLSYLDLLPIILTILILALMFFTLGFILLRKSLEHVKKKGTLSHY
tara:strand:- start:283 stop:1005 length:723 start_codon:yes stop_codon:yes gene_type:complete